MMWLNIIRVLLGGIAFTYLLSNRYKVMLKDGIHGLNVLLVSIPLTLVALSFVVW